MELAIDTSTEMASIAVVSGESIIAELSWYCDQNHTIQLLPRVSELLQNARLVPTNIDAVIVARGPGSFNGLRVGVSTAKGLAFSLGVPLVGISTLEATAYQYAALGQPVCAIFEAGRQEIAAAIYQLKRGKWQQILAEHITMTDKLCAGIASRTVFCGEIRADTIQRIKDNLGSKATIASMAGRVRRAAFLAELGRQRLATGEADNAATLQPLYLRPPAITLSKAHGVEV